MKLHEYHTVQTYMSSFIWSVLFTQFYLSMITSFSSNRFTFVWCFTKQLIDWLINSHLGFWEYRRTVGQFVDSWLSRQEERPSSEFLRFDSSPLERPSFGRWCSECMENALQQWNSTGFYSEHIYATALEKLRIVIVGLNYKFLTRCVQAKRTHQPVHESCVMLEGCAGRVPSCLKQLGVHYHPFLSAYVFPPLRSFTFDSVFPPAWTSAGLNRSLSDIGSSLKNVC